jgi:hypothetical protein
LSTRSTIQWIKTLETAGHGMLALFQPGKRPQITDSRRAKSTKTRTNKREETVSNTSILSLMLALIFEIKLAALPGFQVAPYDCYSHKAQFENRILFPANCLYSNDRDIKDKLSSSQTRAF